MKPGVKTSEFILSVAGIVISLWFGIQEIIPPELSVKVAGFLTAIYTFARAIVKCTSTTRDDRFLDKLRDLYGGKRK